MPARAAFVPLFFPFFLPTLAATASTLYSDNPVTDSIQSDTLVDLCVVLAIAFVWFALCPLHAYFVWPCAHPVQGKHMLIRKKCNKHEDKTQRTKLNCL